MIFATNKDAYVTILSKSSILYVILWDINFIKKIPLTIILFVNIGLYNTFE